MPALADLTLRTESSLAFVGVGREVGLAPLASSWLALDPLLQLLKGVGLASLVALTRF